MVSATEAIPISRLREVTPKMEDAGYSVLKESGPSCVEEFPQEADRLLVVEIFRAMISELERSVLTEEK